MEKSTIIQKDYSKFHRNYQLKISSELDILLPCDESVRLLSEVMEALDYTQLYRAYSSKGRKPKTSPITMFKILVYGSMEGKYAGRELSRACRRDINYMWLLGDEPAPDHNALNRFRSKHLRIAIEDLFYQLVRKLHEIGEIKYEHLFVDGTKIEANANKYTFVWKKSTGKYQERLKAKLEVFLLELCGRYGWLQATPQEAHQWLSFLRTEPFVYGKGKRKSQLQRDIRPLSKRIKL